MQLDHNNFSTPRPCQANLPSRKKEQAPSGLAAGAPCEAHPHAGWITRLGRHSAEWRHGRIVKNGPVVFFARNPRPRFPFKYGVTELSNFKQNLLKTMRSACWRWCIRTRKFDFPAKNINVSYRKQILTQRVNYRFFSNIRTYLCKTVL